MPDDPGATPTPDDPGTGGDGGQTPTPTDPTAQATADDLASLTPEARALVERANAEAATRRRELREATKARDDAQRELAELRKAQESEQEKLVREAEERGFAKAAPMILEAELAIAASGRMREPGDAFALVTTAQREELLGMADPAARREKAVELVEALIEARPYMAVDANGGGPQRPGVLMTPGPRSQQPGKGQKTPDEWLRSGSSRRATAG